ncbi:MAG: ParB/RepB/Spo0J family partition protein [Gemmatimonadaceae bacterium]|jgi:ParB family chromosome partitioning protein|nr:ParB/RepB/Spo0J family partition protein [Gemmatimonadaceae bacterium]
MAPEQPRRLGRGLEALLAISKTQNDKTTAAAAAAPGSDAGAMLTVRMGDIRPNPYQPRKEFKLEELAELQASLKASGLLQPIALRPSPTGQGYELIAGERRFRAATALGWTDIPAVVHQIDDKTLLTLALIENLQRSNLNPLEEAEGYKRLIDEFGLTQQQVGEVVGKDRSTVANLLRLLALPAAVRRLLGEGALSLGHARALLALPDERQMVDLAREAAAAGMSVREVERRVQGAPGAKRAAPPKPARAASGEARRIEDQLRRHLQTDVAVRITKGKKATGEIRVHFYNDDDLARVLDLILGHDRD